MNQPPKVKRPEPAPRVLGELERRWPGAGAADRARLVQELAERPWPIVESCGDGTSVVTFVWNDARARAVLLFVNRLTDERDLGRSAMTRLGGSDLWVLSYRMADDWRASYAFVVHDGDGPVAWTVDDGQPRLRRLLDDGRPDPRNPVRTVNKAGCEVSVVQLDDAPHQPWNQPPGGPRPALAYVPDATGVGPVWIHRAGAPEASAPVAVIIDGETWMDRYSLPAALDAAVAGGALPPLHAVFVGTGDRADRWRDVGHEGGVTAFVGEHLIPWLRRRGHDPARTVVIGQSLGAVSALWAVARYPSIDAAVSQSASLWFTDPTEVLGAGARVYLEVGRQEWVLLSDHRRLAAHLESAGSDLRYREFNGGHDYACWRGSLFDGLTWALRQAPRRAE